jgi:hypothetical protein
VLFKSAEISQKPHTYRAPVGLNIREASLIQRIDPAMKMFLALETVSIGFIDSVRRVGKHQINVRAVQRDRPFYAVF